MLWLRRKFGSEAQPGPKVVEAEVAYGELSDPGDEHLPQFQGFVPASTAVHHSRILLRPSRYPAQSTRLSRLWEWASLESLTAIINSG
jgi:hypothetical protein